MLSTRARSLRRSVVTGLAALLAVAGCSSSSPSASSGNQLYKFSGGELDSDWVVYDSTKSSDPDARVPSLVTVSGGELHVATSGSKGSGLCLCGADVKPTQPYGRWDVRARASVNPDHGFAILLWPNSGKWPEDGELDIAEFPGSNRSLLQTTVHYGTTNRKIMKFTHGDFAAWHTYSVVWRPTAVTYLVDDRPVLRVTDRAAIPTDAMHLALQAGADSDHPSDTTATLDVAWVKYSP